MKLSLICICVSFVVLQYAQQCDACREEIEKALGLKRCHKGARPSKTVREGKPAKVEHRPERLGPVKVAKGEHKERPGPFGDLGKRKHEKPCKSEQSGCRTGKGEQKGASHCARKEEKNGNACHKHSPKPKPIPRPCSQPHPSPSGCPSSNKPSVRTSEPPKSSPQRPPSHPGTPPSSPCSTGLKGTTGNPVTTPCNPPSNPGGTKPEEPSSAPSPCDNGLQPGCKPCGPEIPSEPLWGCGYWPQYPFPGTWNPELPCEPTEWPIEPWNPNYPYIPPYETLCKDLKEEFDRIKAQISYCVCRQIF